MTFAVDWALKTNYLSVFFFFFLVHSNGKTPPQKLSYVGDPPQAAEEFPLQRGLPRSDLIFEGRVDIIGQEFQQVFCCQAA